jgi:3-hydroxyisobutyrate dehydrogenase-like beta-hydroxyacid dehydrogenase
VELRFDRSNNLQNEEKPMKTRVGFAGLGLMGSRMARNLSSKGFPLTVWNRTAGRAASLVASGAQEAATPRALAEGTDVVVACVSDPAAVEAVIFGADGLLEGVRPGFRYVECSTVSPGVTRRVAEALRDRGADMIEAPVTGSRNGAEQATLLFMVGGRPEVLDELRPILDAMGTKAIHCGDIGDATTVKLIGNSVISFMLEALAEGAVVARKAGIPLEKLIEVIQASGYASPYFAFKGGAILRRDFEQHFSIDLLVKDQGLMLAEAAAQRIPLPGLAAVREVFQSARGLGLGQEDIAAVVKALEQSAGLRVE